MSGRDNATRYDAQWVMYLDDDLKDTACALANKKGNVTVGGYRRVPYGSDSVPTNALSGLVPNARLIVLGHGDEKSTSIGYKNILPETLAEWISIWLAGTRIKRISLHMCYGGGNRGAAVGSDHTNFSVSPFQSFAFKLAARCGAYAEDVTARTESVGAVFNSKHDTSAPNYGHRIIMADSGNRNAGAGDKATFTTNMASRHDKPIDPSVSIRT